MEDGEDGGDGHLAVEEGQVFLPGKQGQFERQKYRDVWPAVEARSENTWRVGSEIKL